LESPDGGGAFKIDAAIASTHGTGVQRLLLTVKSHQCADALAAISHCMHADSVVVTLQNGLGSIEEMHRYLGASSLAAGTTTEGAWLRSPFSVVHAGIGETWLGPYPGVPAPSAPERLLGALRRSGATLGWDPVVLNRLWQKLALNCVVNPLTALLNCRNGELLEHAPSQRLLKALTAEVEAIVSAAGHTPSQPLAGLLEGVLRATAANRSSMLQDLSAGRPSEVEYINGYLAATAVRLGRPAPLNNALLELIRTRELLAGFAKA
jgi:2-dehydropantoate 2-reductase